MDGEREEVNGSVCLCMWAVWASRGFSAGSLAWSFAFFHLSCYLQHCMQQQPLRAPQSNSVKRQVRQKLIIRRRRVIALAFVRKDVNKRIYCANTLYMRMCLRNTYGAAAHANRKGVLNTHRDTPKHTQAYAGNTHPRITETQTDCERSFQLHQDEWLSWWEESSF